MYYLSTGGAIKMYYDLGNLVIVSEQSGKRWEVNVPNLKKDTWYNVEYTWHTERGLQVNLALCLLIHFKFNDNAYILPLVGSCSTKIHQVWEGELVEAILGLYGGEGERWIGCKHL